MYREVGGAEFFLEIAPSRAGDVAARVPGADVEKVGVAGRRIELTLDAERAQRLHGVGRDVESGADLAQCRRLLAHDGLGAPVLQCQRRGEPADPAAYDRNARCAWHSDILPFLSSYAGLTRASMRTGRHAGAQYGLPGQARQ